MGCNRYGYCGKTDEIKHSVYQESNTLPSSDTKLLSLMIISIVIDPHRMLTAYPQRWIL